MMHFMRSLLSLLLLFFSFSSHSEITGQQCFTSHLKNSISINKARRSAYSELTQGQSDRVFNSLLTGEYLAILPARLLDYYARKFHRKGVDLFCDEFKDMEEDLSPPALGSIPSEEWQDFDWRKYKKLVKAALNKKDVEGVKLLSLDALDELKSYPHYYCMMRHLIESIYRFAHFTPLRIQEAQVSGLPSPERLMYKVMRLHLFALGSSFQIDLDSYPIQASGIPILCTELPNLLSDL